jgi:hypothetical protein
VDENDSGVIGIFDRTAVGVVEDDIIFNGQSGHCGSSNKNSAEIFLINEADLRLCLSPAWPGNMVVLINYYRSL